MKWKHKSEIEEKFFGYERNATSLEKYKKYKKFRFFNINQVAMILFLFSRMPTNRKNLEDLIPNSVLIYTSPYSSVNYQVPALVINNIDFGLNLFYYNCPHTIKIIHNLG